MTTTVKDQVIVLKLDFSNVYERAGCVSGRAVGGVMEGRRDK